jgi:hypothetical protein
MASFIPYPDNRIPSADPWIHTHAEITYAKHIGDNSFLVIFEADQGFGNIIILPWTFGGVVYKDKDGNRFTFEGYRGNRSVIKSESGITPSGRVEIYGSGKID